MPTTATCIVRSACLLLGGVLGTAFPLSAAPPSAPAATAGASDLDPDALAALDRMGAALRALKQFTLTSEGSTELVLDNDQKIELDGRVTYKVKAPDKLFLELDSDRQLRQLIYDGNALTVYSPRLKYYAQVDGVGATLGELVDRASTRYGIEMPLADLFLWGTDKAPRSNIRNALHVGGGTLDGEAVEQYAFKQDAADWQVWISKETSLPKKLVINALDDPTQPQYRAQLHWDTRTPVPASAFIFTPPADAARIKLVSATAPVAGEEN